MTLREHILNAVRSIRVNKLRTGLSSLGIIIGVSSVIILLAFGEGTQQSITSSVQSLGTNLLTIAPGGTKQSDVRQTTATRSNTDVFTLADIQVLKTIPKISGISPQVSGRKQVVFGTKNTSTTIYGVLPEYSIVRNAKVQYGNFVSQSDVDKGEKVAVLGTEVVKSLFDRKNPLGQKIKVGNVFFTVVGVMEEKGGNGFSNSDDAIFIPLSTAQKRLFGSNYLGQIAVTVSDAESVTEVKDQIITTYLRKFKINDPDDANFSIINSADILSTIGSITGILKAFLGGIAAISLIVGGIGVMNIMLVSVSERTKEIGIRRAIGALDRDIIFQFLTESVVLTLLGGTIGVLFGYGVVALMTLLGVQAYVTRNVIVLSFSCTVGVGVLFGLLPAYKASKLKPIDALRSE